MRRSRTATLLPSMAACALTAVCALTAWGATGCGGLVDGDGAGGAGVTAGSGGGAAAGGGVGAGDSATVTPLQCAHLEAGPIHIVEGDGGAPATGMHLALSSANADSVTIVLSRAELQHQTLEDWHRDVSSWTGPFTLNASSDVVVSPGPEDGFGIVATAEDLRFAHHVQVDQANPTLSVLAPDAVARGAFNTRRDDGGQRLTGFHTWRDDIDDGGRALSLRYGAGPDEAEQLIPNVACGCDLRAAAVQLDDRTLFATTNSTELGACDGPLPDEAVHLQVGVLVPGSAPVVGYEASKAPHTNPSCHDGGPSSWPNPARRLEMCARVDGAWLIDWQTRDIRHIDREGILRRGFRLEVEVDDDEDEPVQRISGLGNGLVVATLYESKATLEVFSEEATRLTSVQLDHPLGYEYPGDNGALDTFAVLGDPAGESVLLVRQTSTTSGAFSVQRFDCR